MTLQEIFIRGMWFVLVVVMGFAVWRIWLGIMMRRARRQVLESNMMRRYKEQQEHDEEERRGHRR